VISSSKRETVLDAGAPVRSSRGYRWAFMLAMLLIGLVVLAGDVGAQEVVVNKGVEESSVSQNVLRVIFGMRLRSWNDGTPITVFVLDDRSELHRSFCKSKLNMFPHQLRQAWDRMVYSGTGQAPALVSSEEEMRQRVSSTPGGIGYLTSEWLDDSVKILQIR